MYPRYWNNGRVMTLDQVVNFCLVNPLQGDALEWDSQELTDLVAYCASVKPMEPEGGAEGAKE
jgi:cytochrome c